MHQVKRSSPELRGPALQYLMIVGLFIAAFAVILVWHPWQQKNVRGLPTEVAPTTAHASAAR
ncbi:MAG: hypothetical protein JO219_02920 [Candidatus Eremiobacteraeota bacterium]|nr:hypothetical protein [Candidatus Eremiobacteraeota bacterium]